MQRFVRFRRCLISIAAWRPISSVLASSLRAAKSRKCCDNCSTSAARGERRGREKLMPVPERMSPGVVWDTAELARAVDEIERNPEAVVAAVRGLDASVLRYKPNPQKWCVLEILAHLADVELTYGFRMRQIIAQPGSTITPIDQDEWARALNYMDSSVPELLERYRG